MLFCLFFVFFLWNISMMSVSEQNIDASQLLSHYGSTTTATITSTDDTNRNENGINTTTIVPTTTQPSSASSSATKNMSDGCNIPPKIVSKHSTYGIVCIMTGALSFSVMFLLVKVCIHPFSFYFNFAY